MLITGDAVSNYDIGWINLAVDGPDIAVTAEQSLHRLADLNPLVLLPAHGPIPPDPQAALAAWLRRIRRLAQDPAGAVRYGARRILAFALMIHNGIPVTDVDGYLRNRPWVIDADRLLHTTPEEFAHGLIDSMLTSGAITIRDGRLHATADHSPVPPDIWQTRFQPPGRPTTEPAPEGTSLGNRANHFSSRSGIAMRGSTRDRNGIGRVDEGGHSHRVVLVLGEHPVHRCRSALRPVQELFGLAPGDVELRWNRRQGLLNLSVVPRRLTWLIPRIPGPEGMPHLSAGVGAKVGVRFEVVLVGDPSHGFSP